MQEAGRWQVTVWAALAILAMAGVAQSATPPSPAPMAPAPLSPAPVPPGPSPRSPVRETVSVTFLGIHATNEPKENVDPALLPIADELRRSKFNSFRLVVSDTRSVSLGSTWKLPLIEDWEVQIQPQKEADENVSMTLTWVQYVKDARGNMQAQPRLRVPMTIRRGKYFLSGGWRLKEGALLGAVAVK